MNEAIWVATKTNQLRLRLCPVLIRVVTRSIPYEGSKAQTGGRMCCRAVSFRVAVTVFLEFRLSYPTPLPVCERSHTRIKMGKSEDLSSKA